MNAPGPFMCAHSDATHLPRGGILSASLPQPLVAPNETLQFRDHTAMANLHRHLFALRAHRPGDRILDAQIFLATLLLEGGGGPISIEMATEVYLQDRDESATEQELTDALSAAWYYLGLADEPFRCDQREITCSTVLPSVRQRFRTMLFTRYSGDTRAARAARAVGLIMLDELDRMEQVRLSDLEARCLALWGPDMPLGTYYNSLLQTVVFDLWKHLLGMIQS